MARWVKWGAFTVVMFLVMSQLIRPAMTNPEIDQASTIEAKTGMPEDVAGILARSCSDCHSYATKWPWYSKIAPVSWYLAHDVNDGRRHLDLSNWGAYDPNRASRKLEEICKEVREGDMPPADYLIVHTGAKLSDADKQKLCEWTQSERQKMGADGGGHQEERGE